MEWSFTKDRFSWLKFPKAVLLFSKPIITETTAKFQQEQNPHLIEYIGGTTRIVKQIYNTDKICKLSYNQRYKRKKNENNIACRRMIYFGGGFYLFPWHQTFFKQISIYISISIYLYCRILNFVVNRSGYEKNLLIITMYCIRWIIVCHLLNKKKTNFNVFLRWQSVLLKFHIMEYTW